MTKQKSDKRYRIQVIINGNPLTFNNCILLDTEDNSFIKFSDKFGTILIYNKSTVVSMKELKENIK